MPRAAAARGELRASAARSGIRGELRAVPVVHELRVEVRPPWPFRLRGGSPDGLFRRRGDGVQRLIHVGDQPVHVGAAQAAPDRVIFGARGPSRAAVEEGIARMRFATGVDDDLREFHDAFRDDEFIGRAVRQFPHLRVRRRTDPWEAFMWAVTEQLIAFEDAVVIQRRLITALGARCPATGLRDAPSAARIAGQSPARLQSFALTEARAIALRRAAREVAAGRVDLHRDHEAGWRRLLAIPGIGPWTVEMLALQGQGRHDQIPAGDLGYIKLVGRLLTGHPKARAEIPEVRAFFARYGEWKGLAGEFLRASSRLPADRVPARAGTRS
jgi:3-methyladenine DNA glycosylase/8-oxoguanine DNA glycosylase